MALSVRDFQRTRSSGALSLGNVHVQVEDYLRDQNGRALAVQGINLKDGSEVTIRLADAERFAKLYLNPNEDMALRVKTAEQQIEKRTTMREIGAQRGNKAVPIGGVVSISNVRPDLVDGELYGRWPNAVVTDTRLELAMPAVFEVKPSLIKTADKEIKTAYIQAYFPKSALSGDQADRASLDRLLSGKLHETGAELRTNLAVTVKLGDETATYALRPKMTKDEQNNYITTKGVEEALSGPIKRLGDAAAAVAVAAKADLPFDQLRIELPPQMADKIDALRDLYDGIADGSTPVTFTPGATMQPSRFMVDALLGRKVNDAGEVTNVRTPEQDLLNRGFVSGVLGVRYIAAETGEVVAPVVKAMFPDNKLPNKDSEYFVRMDLAAVGHSAFLATQDAIEERPKLGHMEPEPQALEEFAAPAARNAPAQTRDNAPADDEDNEFIYSDTSPDF